MRSLTIFLIALSTIIMGGCSSPVKLSYDTNTNFTRLKTYSWAEVTPERLDEATVSNAKAAVNQQMAAKGLKEVSRDPDVYVSLDINRKLVWYRDNSYPDLRYRYMSYMSRGALVWSRQYEKELLTVKLISPDSQKVIWHGMSKKVTDPVQSDAKEENDIKESVSKILVNYPPPQVR